MANGDAASDKLYNQETRLRLEALERRFDKHKEEEKEIVQELVVELKTLTKEIQQVREEALKKPSWALTMILMILSNVVVGLTVAKLGGM